MMKQIRLKLPKQKFIDAHMDVAERYAKLSSAKRLQVGCVVVKNDTIIGIGYNGMPSGWDNDCEEEVLVDRLVTRHHTELKTRPEVLHAETNALAKIARSTNTSERSLLFVTHAPCLDCAKLIYQAGIAAVFYRHVYKSTQGIDFLQKCGIEVINVN